MYHTVVQNKTYPPETTVHNVYLKQVRQLLMLEWMVQQWLTLEKMLLMLEKMVYRHSSH